jgi:hypothetical protein
LQQPRRHAAEEVVEAELTADAFGHLEIRIPIMPLALLTAMIV